MNKVFMIVGLHFSLAFLFAVHKEAKNGKPDGDGFAVVELFTSEGCSSCPAADDNVANLLRKKIKNVYVLSFHVDYWNRLGWKDAFSDAKYSNRQRMYAGTFGLQSIYTPQVVVNGSAEFVGSDKIKLTNAVNEGLNNAENVAFNLVAEKAGHKVNIHYQSQNTSKVLLHIALVEPEASTSVRAGENGGKLLHHVNIVRVFETVDAKANTRVVVTIPEALDGQELHLIAYTQDKTTAHILGALQQNLK